MCHFLCSLTAFDCQEIKRITYLPYFTTLHTRCVQCYSNSTMYLFTIWYSRRHVNGVTTQHWGLCGPNVQNSTTCDLRRILAVITPWSMNDWQMNFVLAECSTGHSYPLQNEKKVISVICLYLMCSGCYYQLQCFLSNKWRYYFGLGIISQTIVRLNFSLTW